MFTKLKNAKNLGERARSIHLLLGSSSGVRHRRPNDLLYDDDCEGREKK